MSLSKSLKRSVRKIGLGGLGLIISCTPSLPITESGKPVDEPVNPSAGVYATRVWYVDALRGDGQDNVLGAPSGDRVADEQRYGTFICSESKPLHIVVGFDRPFNKVWIDAKHSGKFKVKGWGAGWSNYILGGKVIGPFEMMDDKTEWGYSTRNASVEESTYIQIDTGEVDSKLFGFEAQPVENNGEAKEFKIDCFKCE